MAKDKIKLVFEIDRFKVIGCVVRNCETKEEYEELVKISMVLMRLFAMTKKLRRQTVY